MSLKKLSFLLLLGFAQISLPALSSETTVRSAFVFNFIKFIEWPQAAAYPKFNLCVIDPPNEYKAALNLLQDREVKKTQPIDVIYLLPNSSALPKIEHCQMIYKTLNATRLVLPHPLPAGVVLVVDEPKETDLDVSIGLIRADDDHLKFFINQDPLNYSGVKASSQLLKLSQEMQGGKK